MTSSLAPGDGSARGKRDCEGTGQGAVMRALSVVLPLRPCGSGLGGCGVGMPPWVVQGFVHVDPNLLKNMHAHTERWGSYRFFQLIGILMTLKIRNSFSAN